MIETTFTPVAGIVGGLLIGLASAGLLLAYGRIAGISGILGRSFFASGGDLAWRIAFLAGLPLGAAIVIATGWETWFSKAFCTICFAIATSLGVLTSMRAQ